MPDPARQRVEARLLLEAVFGPRTFEPDSSGSPIVEASFSLNGKEYNLNVPQSTKDLLNKTLEAFSNYTANQPVQDKPQKLDTTTAAQKLLDLFLDKFTDNNSAILFSNLLGKKVLNLERPSGISLSNPQETRDTIEYKLYSAIMTHKRPESPESLYRHFKALDGCGFIADLNLSKEMVNTLYRNSPKGLIAISKDLSNEVLRTMSINLTILRFLKSDATDDVRTTLSEMLLDVIKTPDKAADFKQLIEYLDKVFKSDFVPLTKTDSPLKANSLLIKMLPLIVEDAYQGINREYLKGDSIKNYIDNVCQNIPVAQLETINAICNRIDDVNTALVTKYCLAIFVKRGINTEETLSNLLDFAKSAPDTTISPTSNKELIDMDAVKLIASMAYEISHPELIQQFGPTCEPTATEYLLCSYAPEKYVSFIAETFNGLCANPDGYNLTSTDSSLGKSNDLHYSMHLFQTHRYNDVYKQVIENHEICIKDGFSNFKGIEYFRTNFLTERGFAIEEIPFNFDFDPNYVPNGDFDDFFEAYEAWELEQREEHIPAVMKEIDNALANGQLIRISYGKDNNDLERGHAAIITKAHYDADGNVTSYDLFHGWDIASIGAHADNLTVARLGETIRAAQKVTLPRTLKELL